MLKPGSVLLNAGRGAVIDNNALLQCDHVITCLDVWENEPTVNLQLLEKQPLPLLTLPAIASRRNCVQR